MNQSILAALPGSDRNSDTKSCDRLRRIAARFGLLAALLIPFSGNAATVEDRLADLEQKVSALKDENAALKKQLGYDAAGKLTPSLVVAQGKETKLALGGFLQTNAEFGDAPDSRFPAADRFLIRRARLGVKGSFAEGFDFVLQSDWGNNSLGSTSGYRAQCTDALVVWTKYPAANVTVGQFKVPYGYDQLLADTKTLTIERTLPNDQLSLPRQIGAMVGGTFFNKRLGYGVALGNGNGNNVSFNDNDQFTTIARVYGTAFDQKGVKLNVGVNGFTGYDTGSFTGRRTGRGMDAQVYVGRAEFDAEVLETRFDANVGADYDSRGWAFTGSYFFVPNQWQGVIRYETYDPNRSIAGDLTTLRTIGVNYLLKGDDIKLQLNYLIGNRPGNGKHQDRLIGRLQLVF